MGECKGHYWWVTSSTLTFLACFWSVRTGCQKWFSQKYPSYLIRKTHLDQANWMLRKWEFSDEITVAIVLYQNSEREAMTPSYSCGIWTSFLVNVVFVPIIVYFSPNQICKQELVRTEDPLGPNRNQKEKQLTAKRGRSWFRFRNGLVENKWRKFSWAKKSQNI